MRAKNPKSQKISIDQITSTKPTIFKVKNLTFKFIIVFCFIILVISSFNLQIIQGNYYVTRSSNINVREKYLLPQRGLFYDINGDLLTKNVEMFDLYLSKGDYSEDEKKSISDTISKNSNIEKDQLINLMASSKELDLKLASNLNSETASKLQEYFKDNNSIYFKSGYKREYVYPEYFSHVIGYTGGVTSEDVKNGYLSEEQKGKYKLESQLENQLKGIKGRSVYVGGVEIREDGEPGDNVYLTINSVWQRKLYNIIANLSDIYNAAGGAGVIVDNSNGNVVSMISYPGLNVNEFVTGIPIATFNDIKNDRRKPLIDKAIGQAAAPGSSFKLITSYALLESRTIDESTHYFSNRCIQLGGGYDFCEFGKYFYGDMDIVRALYKSSNLFFCNNTLKLYGDGNFNRLVDSATLFNIGQKTGINLDGEVAGIMDSPEYRAKSLHLSWYDGDTCNAAIGQGAILTTPIQMAMLVSSIENNGKYYQPNVIDKITDSIGNIVFKSEVKIEKNISIQPKTLDLIKTGMYDVAHNPQGTIYYFMHDVPGNVRAKTGTAEVYENINGQQVYRTHGWIVGAFDFEGKSYSFSFHLAYGGGGFYIGEAAKRFVNCVYDGMSDGCEYR